MTQTAWHCVAIQRIVKVTYCKVWCKSDNLRCTEWSEPRNCVNREVELRFHTLSPTVPALEKIQHPAVIKVRLQKIQRHWTPDSVQSLLDSLNNAGSTTDSRCCTGPAAGWSTSISPAYANTQIPEPKVHHFYTRSTPVILSRLTHSFPVP